MHPLPHDLTGVSHDVVQPAHPNISYPPLEIQEVVERGLFADPAKPNLFGVATKVKDLTPAIGTEITGIDLRHLTDAQKDELCLRFFTSQ